MLEAVLEALELHLPPALISQRDARWAVRDAANPAELRAAHSGARSLDLRAAALWCAEAQLVVFSSSRRELPRRHAQRGGGVRPTQAAGGIEGEPVQIDRQRAVVEELRAQLEGGKVDLPVWQRPAAMALSR